MADPNPSVGTVERRDEPVDQAARDKAAVTFWLEAIALAGADEKDWREEAEKVVKRYRGEKEYANERFRLLYSNVQTMAPALFNSMPVPDIRRRFGDRDEDARNIAQALERTVSCDAEKSDFEAVMEEAVMHRLLPGRAVVRVRYVPKFSDDGSLAYENVEFECVPWSKFRRGPAKRWKQVPWVAFEINPTREDLEKLSSEHGPKVPLNAKLGDDSISGDGSPNPPEVYKRAVVWQIWDKDRHEIVYVSPDYKDAPIAVVQDELKLEAFFPTPEPMLAIKSPDDLRPLTEWGQYAALAEELEDITKRLRKLVKAARWRGVTAKEMGPAFAAMQNADDGVFTPAEDGITFSNEGGLDKAIWIMPIDKLVAAIQQLYQAREQTKQAIYEVTGLADIIRGSTQASETATAQQIKAQWGSLRLQKAQSQVQRYCRDLYRIGVEIVATKFDPRSIMLASGVELTEQQIKLMQRDVMREYRIDVETDSTIRADLSRQQENIGQFVQGFGALVQSLGPVVQDGTMPADVATDLLTGFARSFKLGRQAEEALERLGDQAKQAAKNPQQKPDPEAAKVMAEQQRHQQQLQFEQAKHAMQMEQEQAKLQLEREKMDLQRQQMALDAEAARQQQAFKVAAMAEQARFDQDQRAANAAHEDQRRVAELDFMRGKQALQPMGAQQ